jgi:uncharacterized membrane protein YedE/YeeE
MKSENTSRPPDAYWNPYVAGVLLGLTLLASYLILGAGLGASGGLARASAAVSFAVAPEHTASCAYFGAWAGAPLRYYLVFMFVGLVGGGALSAILACRQALALERGAAYPAWKRVLLALAGGLLVGFASRLAQGCTSGQALSGGAMLLTGSLLFTVFVFAGGYAAAAFVRRQWHD